LLGLGLISPLEDDWRRTLDAVARRRGWPTSQDVAELAPCVKRLSSAYNDAAVARANVRDAGAARLAFGFARDVPKGAAAVRELVAMRALGDGDAPLRVLDVGAGLGATTWGVVRALEACGVRRAIEATWVESDADALELGLDIVSHRQQSHALRVRPIQRRVTPDSVFDDLGQFDLVVVGQLLSELDVGLDNVERLNRHTTLLAALLERGTKEKGSLVIVEPALRDRTRHLHAVRDRLVSLGATVFAPCTHGAPCPALVRETDWCHEDVPVDLPAWLVPVARAAGLRREGLSFSYLVLRKDSVDLARMLPEPRCTQRPLRVVSEQMRSKGKRDAFLCGGLCDDAGALIATRAKVTRLDRDASGANAAWKELMRGDVVMIEPDLSADRPRISSETTVRLVESR
jgi:ribosomal protein RSM22 (predicted rRNA methylase)